MKQRVWELDALRGLCVLGMVVIHLVYDLVDLYGLLDWEYPVLYSFVQNWGGVLFLLISGICVTLGSRCVRRGLIVFACGLLVTAATAGMYFLKMADQSIIIYFGVLHCLGICMLLWPVFRKLPIWTLAATGAILAAAGLLLQGLTANHFWLVPFGIVFPGFASSDYFPLLPHLGFFLLGAVLGKTLYREKKSLLPGVSPNNPLLRFLQLWGKHSLWIYLLHQPLLSGILYLIMLIR